MKLNYKDFNKMTEKQLCKLPGVGRTTAKRVLGFRPFRNNDDLFKVKGLGKKTLKNAPITRPSVSQCQSSTDDGRRRRRRAGAAKGHDEGGDGRGGRRQRRRVRGPGERGEDPRRDRAGLRGAEVRRRRGRVGDEQRRRRSRRRRVPRPLLTGV